MNPEIEQYMNDYVSDLMATREALLESLKYALRDDPKFEDAEVLEGNTIGVTFDSFQFFIVVEDA